MRGGSRLPLFAAVLLALWVMAPLGAQVRPIYSEGAAGLIQKLQRLTTTASAMHTGAHPDDEDSALIARLARGDHARVAYLSLNRGEGGQNILGPDFYEALGVIRTEELLQARALDGGDQLFTRVVDFGFTVNMPETERKWGRAVVLGDMVRAIRLYRPLVVASRFSGTAADGHGNHQLAGALTPVAVKAAADPAQFPEHLREGLRPWQVRKLYVGQRFVPNAAEPPTLLLPTGVLDPALGRTYFQIAMEGRSQHKTQEMGGPLLHGPQSSGLRLIDSVAPTVADERSVFDGIDVTLPGMAALAGLPTGALAAPLQVMDRASTEALEQVDVRRPAGIVPTLARGLQAAREAQAAVASLPATPEARAEAAFLLGHKIRQFEEAMLHASGVHLEALSTAETVVAAGEVTIGVRAFVPDQVEATVGDLSVVVPTGWTQAAAEPPQLGGSGMYARFFREQPSQQASFRVTAPADATPTQPYWLETPGTPAAFVWKDDGPKSVPLGPPLVSARAVVTLAGVSLTTTVPVMYRHIDPVRGELRRPLVVVPALSVQITPSLDVVPLDAAAQPRQITVRVESFAPTAATGEVALDLPAGWTSTPARAPLSIAGAGQGLTTVFEVRPPAGVTAGSYALSAHATAGG